MTIHNQSGSKRIRFLSRSIGNNYGVLRSLCIIFLVTYFISAVVSAYRTPLWMDEVLATWVARLPTVSAIIQADYLGSDAIPPTFSLILHYLIDWFGDHRLVLRLPGILATMASALCLFALLRRSLSEKVAIAGVVLFLLGASSFFTAQARPYALVTFCYALSALVWHGLDKNKPSLSRLAIFLFSLVAAFSFHFYAALFIPGFALAEAARSARTHKIRMRVWATLFVAGLVSFAWLPLILVIHNINQHDVAATGYYAKTTLYRLIKVTLALAMTEAQLMFFLTFYFINYNPTNGHNTTHDRLPRKETTKDLYILLVCSCAITLIVYVFSALFINTFNARYCLVESFGTAGLFSYVFNYNTKNKTGLVCSMVAGLIITPFWLNYTSRTNGTYPLSIVTAAAKPLPVVIGEGFEFFQFMENAPQEFKSRVVYVNRLADVETKDPTNENIVDRWHVIRPDLKVYGTNEFLAGNPHFYVIHSSRTSDTITPWLASRGLLGKEVAHEDDFMLYEAHAPGIPPG